MAHLTRPTRYDIEDSNIALLGSDLEHRVREHAGDVETAWEQAGKEPGIQIWRIEKFHIVSWPKDRNGTFYDGDSYIVLNTYKKDPDADTLSYDLHFWLGENTSQDEAGTAAYKTVELDDHLHGVPVQYREVQGYESQRFLSYFPHLISLHGGVSTGFHHVSEPPPLELNRLYQISASTHHGVGAGTRTHIAIRQVAAQAESLHKGDVFVLDLGTKVLQFNTCDSTGKERFLAADFVRGLVDSRSGQCELTVYDEGGSGAGIFLSTLGAETLPPRQVPPTLNVEKLVIFRISDASGSLQFSPVSGPTSLTALQSSDAFLIDASHLPASQSPAVYVWIGREASLTENRLALQYAQKYLHNKAQGTDGASARSSVSIVRVKEGSESEAFLQAFNSASDGSS